MSDSYGAYCDRIAERRETYSLEKFNVVKRTLKFKKAKQKAERLLKEAQVGVCQCCENCGHYEWVSEVGGGADNKACTKLGLSNVGEMNTCRFWTKVLERTPRMKMKVDNDIVAATLIAHQNRDR